MDKYLIATKQRWELEYVMDRMAQENVFVTMQQVKEAIKDCGRSRRQVYSYLRNNF